VPQLQTQGINQIGTQILGFALVTVYVTVLSWVYFFPIKRLNYLRIPKSVEVLGRDAIMNANSKGLDIESLI
jgi:ammonia channel protein AmtB